MGLKLTRSASTGSTCACEAERVNFKIDCSATAAMQDSLSFLKSGGCAADCSSDTCVEAWLIVQSHHDYCPVDAIPSDIEDDFHDYDEVCASCSILRGAVDGAPDCPTPNCDDNSGNDAYASLVESGCADDCSTAECRNLYFLLRSTHDLCDHDVLTSASEEGLHDFEEHCAAAVCNAEAGGSGPAGLRRGRKRRCRRHWHGRGCPGLFAAYVGVKDLLGHYFGNKNLCCVSLLVLHVYAGDFCESS